MNDTAANGWPEYPAPPYEWKLDNDPEMLFGGPWVSYATYPPTWIDQPSHNLFGQRLDPRTGEPTDKLHDEHVFEWGWWRAGFTYGSAFMVSVPRGKDRA